VIDDLRIKLEKSRDDILAVESRYSSLLSCDFTFLGRSISMLGSEENAMSLKEAMEANNEQTRSLQEEILSMQGMREEEQRVYASMSEDLRQTQEELRVYADHLKSKDAALEQMVDRYASSRAKLSHYADVILGLEADVSRKQSLLDAKDLEMSGILKQLAESNSQLSDFKYEVEVECNANEESKNAMTKATLDISSRIIALVSSSTTYTRPSYTIPVSTESDSLSSGVASCSVCLDRQVVAPLTVSLSESASRAVSCRAEEAKNSDLMVSALLDL
jgi:hypothetical protein